MFEDATPVCVKLNSRWQLGHIDPFWHDDHRRLEYRRGQYNNFKDLKHWEQLGFSINPAGGDVFDMKNIMPDWSHPFFTLFPGTNTCISFFRMNTGDILPAHRDTFEIYRSVNNIQDPSKIYRAIIFLEDWSSGHIFEIDETPVTSWKAGDYVVWNYDVLHMAANLGLQPRYTIQITFYNV
jgi:hypothetical protein